LLVGAIVGIPLAVFVVYKVYRRQPAMSTGAFSTPRPIPGRLGARARGYRV
jgi:hypothetical protein